MRGDGEMLAASGIALRLGRTDDRGFTRTTFPDGRVLRIGFATCFDAEGWRVIGITIGYAGGAWLSCESWEKSDGTVGFSTTGRGRFPSASVFASDAVTALHTDALIGRAVWEQYDDRTAHLIRSAQQFAERIAGEFGGRRG